MHDSVRTFVTKAVAERNLAALDTLEVGSYDENGGVRDLFTGRYLGIDIRSGPGVDSVVDGGHGFYDDNAECFDVAISTETLEHDPRPWLTVHGMAVALRHGGTIILTARGFEGNDVFPRHNYPSDYWRISEEAMAVLLADAGLDRIETRPDPMMPGVFAIARKLQRRYS